MVAAGEADVYPRFGPTNEWDTGAGHAILRAAGGEVFTADGEPLRYGKRETRLPEPRLRRLGTGAGIARRSPPVIAGLVPATHGHGPRYSAFTVFMGSRDMRGNDKEGASQIEIAEAQGQRGGEFRGQGFIRSVIGDPAIKTERLVRF